MGEAYCEAPPSNPDDMTNWNKLCITGRLTGRGTGSGRLASGAAGRTRAASLRTGAGSRARVR